MGDRTEFERDAESLRKAADEFLTKWWGQECPEQSPGCHCCDKRMMLRALLENPFEGDE